MRRGLGTAALLAAVLLAGCGVQTAEGPAAAATRSDRLVDFSKKPPYVNALDLDPEDGSLLLTTNKGFWRIDPKADKVERVRGTARPAEVLAGRDVPRDQGRRPGPLRGLRPSRHEGAAQLPGLHGVRRRGQDVEGAVAPRRADLHKIVLLHGKLYAFDAVLGAMLISGDGGRTFTEQFTPRGLIIDFEVDPQDPDRILASTDQELFRSTNGGKGWRGVAPGEGIRLAWPAPDALYRAEKDGTVQRSRDGGGKWEPSGKVPGEPYKFKALGPEALLLALSDGTVMETKDGGRTWTETFRP